jgi:4-amino-4-deoxy-L-arabinose transferase-like glycosyltransferase
VKLRSWEAAALAISLATVVAAAFISQSVLEAIPHIEDEFASLWQAHVFAQGELTAPSPSGAKSFLIPFVVDYEGVRFSKYPPGWSALLSLAVPFEWEWMINPLLAGLAVWLTFRLGQRFLKDGLALLAGLLLGSSPMLLMLSGTFMSHNLSLVLATAFALAWTDILQDAGASQRGRRLGTYVGGGALGLLFLTRPLTAAAVAIPFLLYGALSRAGRHRWRPLVGLMALAGTIGLILPLWQWAVTGDPLLNPYSLWWPYDRLGFGPDIGVGEAGHTLRQAYSNAKFSLRAGLHDLNGWPYLSWLFVAPGIWALRRRRIAWPVLGVFPSLVLAYSLYWVGAWLFGPRYYYAGLPGWSIANAAGIGWIGGWLSEVGASRWRRLGTTAALGLLMATSVLGYSPIRVGGMKGLFGIERSALAPLEAVGLEHALVIVTADHWTDYANLLPMADPFDDRDVLVAWSRGPVLDRELAAAYPEHDLFWHDPERPNVLQVPIVGPREP